MNRDSVHKLRLDRRLLQRRGWIISAEEQAQAIEALPDVSGKGTTLGAASDDRKGPADTSEPDDKTPPGE